MGGETGVLDERDIVLECVCDERGGKVVRLVRRTKLTLKRLEFLWEKLQEFDVLFNDYTRGDFSAFVDHFVKQQNGELVAAGLMWDLDDVGLFFLNDIKPAISATAHFVFWDRGVGREELCRQMLKYAFDVYKFKRISVEVPLYARYAASYTEKIGFLKEGRLRSTHLYKGKWYDSIVYSMLPGDLDEIPRDQDLSHWSNRRLVCLECGKTHIRRDEKKEEG